MLTVSKTGKYFLLLLLFLGFSCYGIAQKNSIKGIVSDSAENRKLQYAIAALIDLADSTLATSVRTDAEGAFEITDMKVGKYLLMITHPRMADYLKEIVLTETSTIALGNIQMVTEALLLQEVIVQAGLPIRMRGDTLEYLADSFAVRPGANVEELLKRLPGFQVEKSGKIIAQGQEVKKILVDGDEFFSDDPGLASKYIHADAIDKVQVFDKKSDQSAFTGIDDGSKTKTINLKLKKNKKNGSFGKLSAGTAGEGYYNHEAMAALFDASKKMAVFGVATNTGKAGLENADLTKYVGQDYEMIDDGTGGVYYTSNSEYESGNYEGNGLPKVWYGGAHYSNKWNKSREKLNTNYRTKLINAEGWNFSRGLTTLPGGKAFVNESNATEDAHNYERKMSGNFTAAIDSFTTVKLSFNGNLDDGFTKSSAFSGSSNEKGFRVNKSQQASDNYFDNKTFGSNLLYQHKFRKAGRTISVNMQQQYNGRKFSTYNIATNEYFNPESGVFANADTLNQLQNSNTNDISYASRLAFTEKLSQRFAIEMEYGWKTASSNNVFGTFKENDNKYTERIDTLSSDYLFTVKTHIAGTSISYTKKKMHINIGSKLFFTGFKQMNKLLKDEGNRKFINIAPQVNASYKVKENANISLQYSGVTTQPSVEELQPLRRSNNPLYIQLGNPDLKQGFNHNASLNYYSFNWIEGSNFSAGIYADMSNNNVTTKTFTDAQNKTVSQYINMDGIAGINGYLNYGRQYKAIHFDPSLNMNFGRYGNYMMLNNQKVKNESFYSSVNLSLAYNLPDKVSFTYKAGVNYNIGISNISGTTVNRTLLHTHSASTQIFFPKKFELGTDAMYNFQPRNKVFQSNLNIFKWNGYVQKKFLKTGDGFVRISLNDILNSNTGYSRNVYGSNVYESDRLVIKRYWLLTLGWNFSKSIK